VLEARLQAALDRAVELETELSDPATAKNPSKLKSAGREYSRIEPLKVASARYFQIQAGITDAREILDSGDDELADLGRAELEELEPELESLVDRIKVLLVPRDPMDDRDTLVEIRSGAGGDEAALFAADLLRMYTKYSESKGWKIEHLSASDGNMGGLREVIFAVRGPEAYGFLRYESGVHRVQRVPATETQGRIHTSAASVAVLPEAEEIDVEIADADLKIDVYRSSGPGGQSVNTTDSAVRITHMPSGLVVTCQDQKSQLQNKIKAMEVLRSRLLDLRISEQEAKRSRERKAMVGTGDRSAKIRTYNYPQSRVTDHRIGLTLHRLDAVLEGDLGEIVEALRIAHREEMFGG
jgi:peptide chain release factor 1